MPEGRDSKTGQFVVGHTPINHQGIRSLNAAFRKCATEEHIRQLFQTVWELTQDDDHRIRLEACEVLLNRLLGKPTERIEVEAQTHQLASVSTEYLLRELARLQADKEQPLIIDVVPHALQATPHAPGTQGEALASLSHLEPTSEAQKGNGSLEPEASE